MRRRRKRRRRRMRRKRNKKQEEEEKKKKKNGVVTPLQHFVLSHNLRFVSYLLNDSLLIVFLHSSESKGYMKTANDKLRRM
jgi:hypothetical protein